PAAEPVGIPGSEPLPGLHRPLAVSPVAAAPADTAAAARPVRPAGPSVVGGATASTDLVAARVRELIEGTGRIPGRRVVARELGITEHQARTALQRVTTAPPVSNRVSLNGVGGGR
ncbi:MAG TPA: hypothetical protein VN327_03645, partial [Pseudonocardiaceae bacterium]|nr:hypothetical protein [Pseudonocardiaceae bacterium]